MGFSPFSFCSVRPLYIPTKLWRMSSRMTLILPFIWRRPKLIYRSISKAIICHRKPQWGILVSRSLPQHPFLPLHHHHLRDHLKRITPQDSNASALLRMNWLNSGTRHRKILILVIPFDGGTAVVLNSHSSTALFVISSQFQVIISIRQLLSNY